MAGAVAAGVMAATVIAAATEFVAVTALVEAMPAEEPMAALIAAARRAEVPHLKVERLHVVDRVAAMPAAPTLVVAAATPVDLVAADTWVAAAMAAAVTGKN
jgi:hypothetical protein